MDTIENNGDPQYKNDDNCCNLKEIDDCNNENVENNHVSENLCKDLIDDDKAGYNDENSGSKSNSVEMNLPDESTNNSIIDTNIDLNSISDNLGNKSPTFIRKKSKYILEDEDDDCDHRYSHTSTQNGSLFKKRNIIDSDSDEDDIKNEDHVGGNKNPDEMCDPSDNRARALAICDPETSDEENQDEDDLDNSNSHVNEKNVNRFNTAVEEKKKLTGRTALQLRKEIQSESQRMTRESVVNLPYHKPKTRTLKEFLQNRSRFTTTAAASTCKAPPCLAMKMSIQQLKEISEKMSEREKVVKEFFKSESESEEEDDEIVKSDENKGNVVDEKAKPTSSIHILQDITLKPGTKDEFTHSNLNITSDFHSTDQILPNSNDTKQNIGLEDQLKGIDDSNEEEENFNATNTQEKNDLEQSEEFASSERESLDVAEPQNLKLSENNSIDPEIVTNNSSIHEKANLDVNTDEMNEESPKSRMTNLFEIEDVQEDKTQSIITGNDLGNILIEKYTSRNPLDEITNQKDEDSTDNKQIKVQSVMDLVRNKFGDFKPALKGNSDQIINLEDGTIKQNEVNKLVNRFIQHTKKKSPQKHKVKLDVISVSSGEIHKETLEVALKGDESIPINEKPGQPLKLLREDLQKQMALRRSELWQQKPNLKGSDAVENDEEADNDEKDILDDEEEEFTESEEEEEDILEDDCDDVDDVGTEKPKSAFLDEEAEESDIDQEETDVANDNNEGISDEDYPMENADSDNDCSSQSSDTPKKKKLLKRIIKPFSNESEDEEDNRSTDIKCDTKTENSNQQVEKNNLDSTDTWDENCELTPHQARNCKTPVRNRTQSRTELGFLTPVLQLTGLQSLNSGSEFLRDRTVSPFVMPTDFSPSQSTQDKSQQKIVDNTDLATTQELSEVAKLCSGTFSSQTDSKTFDCVDNAQELGITQETPSTQDLLEICSGKFTGITQIDKGDKDTINRNGKNQETQNVEISSSNEIKSLDDEDKLISELLNEEDLDDFKKKFESPVDEGSSIPINRIIYDSSEDENEIGTNTRRKQRRKLVFSDDDGSDDEVLEQEIDDDVSERCGSESIREVEYDSEENEVEIDIPKKMRIADFVENEAELSESEWGSADEDEGGLDELEIEDGDKEKLDEEQVKRDLERIHMRRLLDDDTHEVKLLQELLLDDGEMHGNGRERQFRWKNIDSLEFPSEGDTKNDGEVYLDEDEDEEKWRKMRYEREIFLKKELNKAHSITEQDEDLSTKGNSQVIKLGQAAIKRSFSSVIPEKSTRSVIQETKEPISLLSKRGSFLSRTDEVLQRLAMHTKVVTSSTGANTKSSRNFVFSTVAESSEAFGWSKKRKANEGTPSAIKKLRLNNSSPSVQKKEKTTNSKAKKLFSVW